jgi:micrococcal nuclease
MRALSWGTYGGQNPICRNPVLIFDTLIKVGLSQKGGCVDSMLIRSMLTIAVAFSASPTFCDPVAVLSGVADVQDGDGLLFGRVEVRLQGIAAPELEQPMGPESYQNLVRLAQGKQVRCELDGTVANRRPVGVCFADGRDVGRLQVEQGFALDCARYSKGRYREAEALALNTGNDLSAAYELPSYCGN